MEAIIPAGQIKTVPQRPTAFLASRYAAVANNGGGIAKADGLVFLRLGRICLCLQKKRGKSEDCAGQEAASAL